MPISKLTFNDPKLRDVTGLVQLMNCKLLRNGKFIVEDLWVENGKIVNPEPVFFLEKRKPHVQIDCKNYIVAPGYIDMQINGGFGVDFSSDPDRIVEHICTVAEELVQFGVTAFCPTIVSTASQFYKTAIKALKNYKHTKTSAICLGLHLEGPFINKEKKGAHAVQHFVDGFPDGFSDLEEIYGADLSPVSLVTLAPELINAMIIIEKLTSRGVKVSLGHSTASISDGEAAVIAGASCITHLFNAMLPFHHRDPGLVGLLTSANIPQDRTLFFGVIADGVHTHDAALRIAHRTHPDGLILVTDAVALLGLEGGLHRLGDMTIEVKGRRAIIAGTDSLTGSISSMDYCVRHFHKAARCDKSEALMCASCHPAQFLGISDRKGSLEFGRDADFLVLSENLHVLATFIAGQLVWAFT